MKIEVQSFTGFSECHGEHVIPSSSRPQAEERIEGRTMTRVPSFDELRMTHKFSSKSA